MKDQNIRIAFAYLWKGLCLRLFAGTLNESLSHGEKWLFQPFFQPIDLPEIRFTVTPKAEDVRPVSILRQVGGCHMFFCGRY